MLDMNTSKNKYYKYIDYKIKFDIVDFFLKDRKVLKKKKRKI